jgi:hypothetical protein
MVLVINPVKAQKLAALRTSDKCSLAALTLCSLDFLRKCNLFDTEEDFT